MHHYVRSRLQSQAQFEIVSAQVKGQANYGGAFEGKKVARFHFEWFGASRTQKVARQVARGVKEEQFELFYRLDQLG